MGEIDNVAEHRPIPLYLLQRVGHHSSAVLGDGGVRRPRSGEVGGLQHAATVPVPCASTKPAHRATPAVSGATGSRVAHVASDERCPGGPRARGDTGLKTMVLW